jgi:alkanesulfonate monooxygenase SsuD/methylene tetrahydromethanopterin reductase-like flavin-dependent oxidoreductase (luciferase family)/predicted kinase
MVDGRYPASVPDPALVVLIGPSGAGKSTWAAAHYLPHEVVSSDALRAVVGSGEHDLAASADAFVLLEHIVAARARRGLTTVVDTLGLEPSRRRRWRELARSSAMPAVLVRFDTDAAECRRRNRSRSAPVPATALDAQLRRMVEVGDEIPIEGWDLVLAASADVRPEPDHSPGSARAGRAQAERPTELAFVLHISRFGWGDDPADWLRSVALAADEAGFTGIALMDHLIQIPQVGRAWEPIPEPWVTLGMLAALPTRLRLGSLVSPVTFRPAGVLAKTVATLDALSGGRAFCGLGAGWWEREHAAYGVPFPSVPERMDLLETTVETLRALWAPGTRAHAGRVNLPETTCYPRPSGRIPIIVGGSGERRTLQLAARHGDGCNLGSDLQTLDRKLTVLRAHCRQAGRDPAEVAVTVLDLPVLGTDRAQAARLVETLRGRTPAAAFARRHHAGIAADHIGRYRLLAERGVDTVFVSPPGLAGPDEVSRFGPVLAAFR